MIGGGTADNPATDDDDLGMGRPKRAAAGGWIFYVLNRANGRYVERNALRANLAILAEEWRWSSL